MCLPGWFVALWRSTEESAATPGTLPICKNGILEQYATNDVDRVFIFSSKRHEFVLLGGTTEPTKTRNAPCSAARLRLLGHFLPPDAGNTRLPPNHFHSGVGVVLEAFPNKLHNYAQFS
jgi:hypothetical protein